MTNRREFMQRLMAASVGAQLIDWDQLLWTPKSMIVVPTMPTHQVIVGSVGNFDSVLTDIAARYISNGGLQYIAEAVCPLALGDLVEADSTGRVRRATPSGRIVGVVIDPKPSKLAP